MAQVITAQDLLQKMEALELEQELGQAIQATVQTAVALQRLQLKRGQGQDGKSLSPKYSEDSYFKSAESAHRYALWKQKLNPEAPFDTPDLYINGTTHNAIFGQVVGAIFRISSNVPWAGDLDRKYRGAEFGLNEESIEEYRPTFMPVAMESIKQKTGLQ